MTIILGWMMVLWMGMSLAIYGLNPIYAQAVSHYYGGEYTKALALLDQIPENGSEPKSYLKSMIFLKQKRFDDALAVIQLVTGNVGLKDYQQYITFKIALDSKNLSLSQKIVEQQWDYENIFLLRKSQLDYAQFLYDRGEYKDAARYANIVLSTPKEGVLHPLALRILISIAIDQKNKVEAFRLYSQLAQEYPKDDLELILFTHLCKKLGIKAQFLDIFSTPEDGLRYVQTLDQYELNYQIKRNITEFILRNEETPFYGEFHFLYGKSLLRSGEYRKALTMFEKALAYTRDSERHHEYYYYACQGALALKDSGVLRSLKKLAYAYPNNPYESWALYWLCRYYQDRSQFKDFEKTMVVFEKKYGKTDIFSKYQWEMQKLDLYGAIKSEKSDSEIRRHLDNVVQNGLVAKNLFSFYSQKGLKKGLQQYPLHYQTWGWLQDYYAKEDPFPSSLQAISHTMELLYQSGLGVLATQELDYLAEAQPDTLQGLKLRYLYGTLVAKIRGALTPDLANIPEFGLNPIQFVRVHMPQFVLKLFYPRVYWEEITKYSKMYQVDPYLVLAIMREESAFDERAVSRVNAVGLMQVMPRTGKDVSFRLGLKWSGAESLYEPNLNIRLGTYYISWLQKQFKGPDFYAIAAYNAGPETAWGWIKRYGGEDAELFVSNIPYGETRQYVKRVLNSYMVYKLIYDQK